MKFLADRMLGRLAKKLRMLGIDTMYYNIIEEGEIIEIVVKEKRVLLTRDSELHSRCMKKGLESFLLKSNYWDSQLRAVFHRFINRSDQINFLTRCSHCNSLLESVSYKKIKYEVPEYVLFTNDQFLKCYGCGQLYWKGSHVKNIINTFIEVLGKDFPEERIKY
ncbi:MAG: Mut7-C RNAse domain-containing protein [Thermotogota bacterium]|nr:Mut7-C RNAse domain-containing protein [Thermotogota bacterium]